VYHGKKTVPATLRKDMWTPYFSMHFPSPTTGLEAYRLLREFSIRRQLSPPTDIITNSDANLSRKRPKDPLEAEKWDKEWKPRMGQIMQKKLRARILMDQKATSVADVAAVLTIQEEKAEKAAAQGGEAAGKKQRKLSHRARKRIARARRLQQQHEKKIRERIRCIEHDLSSKNIKVKITNKGQLERKDLSEKDVKILWTDIQDAQYAESWPKGVIHGKLSPVRGHIIGKQFRHDMSKQAADMEGNADAQSVPKKVDSIAEASVEKEQQEEDKATSKTVLSRLKFWKK
jgi:hypothetical protein